MGGLVGGIDTSFVTGVVASTSKSRTRRTSDTRMSLPPTAIKTPPAAATAAGNPFAKAFRAEAAVWDLARQGKVKPMVVLSRLGPITILADAAPQIIRWIGTDRAAARSQFYRVDITCRRLLLPTLLFMVLDNKLNATVRSTDVRRCRPKR